MLRERADRLLNDLLDAATLGTYEAGDQADDEGAAAGTDGRGRGRARSASAARA